jgi:hypothetical protein
VATGSRALSLGLIPFALLAARMTATRYWGGEPPCGPLRVNPQPLPAGVLGQADQASCTIRINNRYKRWPWPALCTIAVHEAGHLHGLTHASPYWVMHATYRGAISACVSRSPWLGLPDVHGSVLTDWPS